MQRLHVSLALLLAGFATACGKGNASPEHTQTLGDHGRVEFAYIEWFSTYSMDHGLLPGTTMSISMSGAGNQVGAQVASSDPNVANFLLQRSCSCTFETANSASARPVDESGACEAREQKECSNWIQVTAVAPGSTKLELRDANQAIIDSVTVIVSSAASGYLEASRSSSDEKPTRLESIAISASETLYLTAQFADANGKPLLGWAGSYATDDPAIATVSTFFMPSVTGVAPGTTTLRIQVSGVELQIPVTVTP